LRTGYNQKNNAVKNSITIGSLSAPIATISGWMIEGFGADFWYNYSIVCEILLKIVTFCLVGASVIIVASDGKGCRLRQTGETSPAR